MSLLRTLILILLTAIVSPVAAQCVSQKLGTPRISDLYTDAVQYQDQLVLSNSFGFFIKDVNNLSESFLHVEAVPGDVSQVAVSGNRLIVTARDTGVYIYSYAEETDGLPTFERFLSVPGLQSVSIAAPYLFAALEDQVIMYRFSITRGSGFGPLVEMDRITGAVNDLVAGEHELLLQQEDGAVHIAPFNANGFAGAVTPLVLDGETAFYDLEYQDGRFVVDGLSGVRWVELNGNGMIARQGVYFQNKGRDIVMAGSMAGPYLYLRFADRLEVHRVAANGSTSRMASLAQPFSEVGITLMRPGGDFLHVLNTAQSSRNWSLTSYQVRDNRLDQVARLDADFEELKGVAVVGDNLFFASNRNIFLANDLSAATTPADFPLLTRLDGNITALVGSDSMLYAAIAIPKSGIGKVIGFEVGADGDLTQVVERFYEGTIEGLSQFNDSVAYAGHYRATTGEYYTGYVLLKTENGFAEHTLQQTLPLQSMSPFRDFQISDLGVSYHNGKSIRLHQDPGALTAPPVQINLESGDGDLQKTIAGQGLLWAETAQGLVVFDAAGQRDSSYDHWHNLIKLSNNLILAQNRRARVPSRYNLLTPEEGIVRSRVVFSTSTEPTFITLWAGDVFVAEKDALNLYRFDCPSQSYQYLVPSAPGLELELSTFTQDTDAIVMTIFNAANDVIGKQSLDTDLIDSLNGKETRDWLFDFDQMQEPAFVILESSRALAPVISGFPVEIADLSDLDGPIAEARFAYRVPIRAGSNLYVPHVPRDLSMWVTDIYVDSIVGDGDEFAETKPLLTVSGSTGEGLSNTDSNGGTQVINLEETLFVNSDPSPWATISAEDLGASLSGFSLFQDPSHDVAAAVPLISELSDFLIVPHLARNRDPDAWTGLVLANPNNREVSLRVIGYNPAGDIAFDRTMFVSASNSLVVLAEDWLAGLDAPHDIRWLALVADAPILGIALFGHNTGAKLSGIPLSPDSSTSLLFSGIRTANKRWTALEITNVDALNTPLQIDAYDGLGRLVGQARQVLTTKENRRFDVAELYADLSPPEIASIQTIRVTSRTFITGFMERGRANSTGTETVTALVEEEELPLP